MKKINIFIILICLFISGCYGDEYDKLKVVDGSGRIFILKHHFGDNYFIEDISSEPSTPNEVINKTFDKNFKE